MAVGRMNQKEEETGDKEPVHSRVMCMDSWD
jgi:hypothetical protein